MPQPACSSSVVQHTSETSISTFDNMRCLFVLALVGLLCLVDGRKLRQDPMTLTTVKGDQPLGTYALTGHDAESGAASGAKGVRYNEGWVGMAGDGAPGPLALGHAGAQTTRSGNTMAEPVVNMGHEIIASTYEGARAVAGSKVADTAEDKGLHAGVAHTGTSGVFRAGHVNNRGSHAFTENGGTSTATTGQGNGPAALAFGAEIAAFSRSHRNKFEGGGPRDGFP